MPRDFTKLWAASAVSNMGDGIMGAAFPLLVASITRDPLLVSVGKHQVTLRLGRTPPRVVAEVVSAVALLPLAWLLGPGMAGVWVGARRRPRAAWGLLLALGVLAAWLRLGPSPAYNDAAASWDFAQLAYLHPAPAGIPFADGVRLARYAYDRDDVLAGRRLVLTLEWDAAAAGGPVEVALVTPADTRPALLAQVRPPAVARGEGAVAPGISRVELAIPADAPAGLYVPRLRRPGVPAVTPARQSRGDLYLKPVRIRAPDAPVLAESALPVTPTLIVQPAAVQVRGDGALDVRLRWTTFQPLGANYAVSLRLAESDGPLLAQFDGQPGFGFLPSSGWPVNEPVYDWLALPRPAGLDGADQPLSLTVTLYDPVTLEPVLVRRLGELSGPAGALAFRPTEPVFVLPPGLTPQAVTFQDPSDGRDLIRLHGFTVDLAGDALDLTLYWGALVGGLDDFRVFVHVVDPTGDTIVAQADGRPQAGAYPTGQWVVGEVVADPVRLTLDAAPPGSYDLYVGLYRLVDGAPLRLPARDDAAGPVADARVKLPFLVTRSR